MALQFKIAQNFLVSYKCSLLLQLVREIINGVCYQRYEKGLEQQKGRTNVNVCAAEEKNSEEEL